MQARRGKMKNKLVRLLQLSALAITLHLFGAQLASGTTRVAADCGVEWTREAVDLAMARGPHPTARVPEAAGSVHEDIACQAKASSLAEVAHRDEIKEDLPEPSSPRPDKKDALFWTCLSRFAGPLERARNAKWGKWFRSPHSMTHPQKLAPTEPVQEIGKVLPQLFHFVASTPADQEIRLSKVDLSAEFCRLLVEPAQKQNFCCVMPDPP